MESVDKLRGLIADMSVDEIADHVQFSYKDTEIRTVTDYEMASRLIPEVHKPWLDSWRGAVLDALEQIEDEVAADYIPLPLDTDDVLLRPDDEVEVGCWPGTPCVVRDISLVTGMTGWVLHIVQRDHEGEPGYGELYLPWPDNRASETVRHVKSDSWKQIIEDATALGAQMGRRTVQVDDFVARCKALAGEDA